MAIKIGEKLQVKDDEGDWIDGEVRSLGHKIFWVDAGGVDIPFAYHEHKSEWIKRRESE